MSSPTLVIPAAIASVVTTNLNIEQSFLPKESKVTKKMTVNFFNHPLQKVDHQTTNPYIGAAATAGTSISTSNVSLGSLPSAQFSSKPFLGAPTNSHNSSSNVMPDGSTMLAAPNGPLLSGDNCMDNKKPCYTGTSASGFVKETVGGVVTYTYGNQPVFPKAELIGLTGQKQYHFSMGSTNNVGNHSSIFYSPLIEKALTGDGHQVSPGFTVSH
jgi:hypothetical protein